MWLFRVLSHVFTRFLPIFIVGYNHFYVEGKVNYPLILWILLLFLVYWLYYKPMKEKTHIWEIQRENEFLVLNFKHITRLFVFIVFWRMWVILHADYDIFYQTLAWIVLSLAAGWIFALLEYITTKKEETN